MALAGRCTCKRFPLEELESAQTLMRQRKVFGKLLLDPTLR